MKRTSWELMYGVVENSLVSLGNISTKRRMERAIESNVALAVLPGRQTMPSAVVHDSWDEALNRERSSSSSREGGYQ